MCLLCPLALEEEGWEGLLGAEVLGYYSHSLCMRFSPGLQCKMAPPSDNEFLKEIKRARKLMCGVCKKKGSSQGCAVQECARTFHLPCAIKNNFHLDFNTYQIYCKEHVPGDVVAVPVDNPVCCKDNTLPDGIKPECCDSKFHKSCIVDRIEKGQVTCPSCENGNLFRASLNKSGINFPGYQGEEVYVAPCNINLTKIWNMAVKLDSSLSSSSSPFVNISPIPLAAVTVKTSTPTSSKPKPRLPKSGLSSPVKRPSLGDPSGATPPPKRTKTNNPVPVKFWDDAVKTIREYSNQPEDLEIPEEQPDEVDPDITFLTKLVENEYTGEDNEEMAAAEDEVEEVIVKQVPNKKKRQKIKIRKIPLSERPLLNVRNGIPCNINECPDQTLDYSWQLEMNKKKFFDLTDVNDGEKSMLWLWNEHLETKNGRGFVHLPSIIQEFVQKNAETIFAKSLYRNFCLLVASMEEAGAIDPVTLLSVITQLQKCVVEASPSSCNVEKSRAECVSSVKRALNLDLPPSPSSSYSDEPLTSLIQRNNAAPVLSCDLNSQLSALPRELRSPQRLKRPRLTSSYGASPSSLAGGTSPVRFSQNPSWSPSRRSGNQDTWKMQQEEQIPREILERVEPEKSISFISVLNDCQDEITPPVKTLEPIQVRSHNLVLLTKPAHAEVWNRDRKADKHGCGQSSQNSRTSGLRMSGQQTGFCEDDPHSQEDSNYDSDDSLRLVLSEPDRSRHSSNQEIQRSRPSSSQEIQLSRPSSSQEIQRNRQSSGQEIQQSRQSSGQEIQRSSSSQEIQNILLPFNDDMNTPLKRGILWLAQHTDRSRLKDLKDDIRKFASVRYFKDEVVKARIEKDWREVRITKVILLQPQILEDDDDEIIEVEADGSPKIELKPMTQPPAIPDDGFMYEVEEAVGLEDDDVKMLHIVAAVDAHREKGVFTREKLEFFLDSSVVEVHAKYLKVNEEASRMYEVENLTFEDVFAGPPPLNFRSNIAENKAKTFETENRHEGEDLDAMDTSDKEAADVLASFSPYNDMNSSMNMDLEEDIPLAALAPIGRLQFTVTQTEDLETDLELEFETTRRYKRASSKRGFTSTPQRTFSSTSQRVSSSSPQRDLSSTRQRASSVTRRQRVSSSTTQRFLHSTPLNTSSSSPVIFLPSNRKRASSATRQRDFFSTRQRSSSSTRQITSVSPRQRSSSSNRHRDSSSSLQRASSFTRQSDFSSTRQRSSSSNRLRASSSSSRRTSSSTRHRASSSTRQRASSTNRHRESSLSSRRASPSTRHRASSSTRQRASSINRHRESSSHSQRASSSIRHRSSSSNRLRASSSSSRASPSTRHRAYSSTRQRTSSSNRNRESSSSSRRASSSNSKRAMSSTPQRASSSIRQSTPSSIRQRTLSPRQERTFFSTPRIDQPESGSTRRSTGQMEKWSTKRSRGDRSGSSRCSRRGPSKYGSINLSLGSKSESFLRRNPPGLISTRRSSGLGCDMTIKKVFVVFFESAPEIVDLF